jgi:SpoVK/Ycf46/Vps4 family AAA+-type ATPase
VSVLPLVDIFVASKLKGDGLQNKVLNLCYQGVRASVVTFMRGVAYHNAPNSRGINLSLYGDILNRMKKVSDSKCPINNLVMVLYGPAGSGKSFSSTFFSDHLNTANNRLDIYEQDGITLKKSSDLVKEISDASDYAVWLIDEVDTYTKPDELRLLHEVLDDIKARDVRCFIIMTTNHIDKIKDLPLTRPGRVDIIREIGFLTEGDAKLVCERWGYDWDVVSDKVTQPYTVAKVTQACRELAIEEIVGG